MGRDRSGIVCRTSPLMASHGIHIVDVETRMSTGPDGSPTLTTAMQIAVPEAIDGRGFRRRLEALARDLRVEIIPSRATKSRQPW